MLDENKVIELRNWRNATMGRQDGTHSKCCRLCTEAPETFKTLEVLWRVARVAEDMKGFAESQGVAFDGRMRWALENVNGLQRAH